MSVQSDQRRFFASANWYLLLGVVGLTTAIALQETGGYQVTILAEVFPNDAQTIRYTSFWAVSAVLPRRQWIGNAVDL